MQADGRTQLIKYGNNADVVKNILLCYDRWKNQPEDIVDDLRGLSVEEACQSIFAYITENVRYKVDGDGVQYIKSPARLIADGIGDCKSLTLFTVACLYCLGIPHKIRFVNFDGGNQYTHVYAIAIDENGRDIILDTVETTENNNSYPAAKVVKGHYLYDYARPYVKKREFIFR